MIKRTSKYQAKLLKEKINKLVGEGFSYDEIAKVVGLKSRQLARYHFLKYRKELSKKGRQENNKKLK